MAKAGDKRSPKPGRGKTPSEPLPPKTVEQYPLDDDTRWRPIGAAYRRRFEQTENVPLSIFQVMDVLEKGELPSKEQSVVTGQSRLLLSTEWTERVELQFLSGGPRVVHREPRECVIARRSQVVLLSVRGFQFFVWWPTVEKLWPAVTDHIDKAARETKITPVAPDTPAADPPPKIDPQTLYAELRKKAPQQHGERIGAYATRVHKLMQAQEANLTSLWARGTVLRNLHKEAEDERAKPAPKARRPTDTR